MARKLVVCCDGTWNTPRTQTNIFRTYHFLRERLGNPAEMTQKNGVTSCGGRKESIESGRRTHTIGSQPVT